MRHGYPSKAQLKLNFDSALAQVLEGRGVRTETGLDMETRAALMAIARAHPNVTDKLVEAARHAFGGQLDGGNAAHRRTELDRKLAERAARLKRSPRSARTPSRTSHEEPLMPTLPMPPWMNPADPDRQREIDEQTSARTGISIERLSAENTIAPGEVRDHYESTEHSEGE
ncbi:hypothetical protein AB0I30_24400 [Nocardia tengchongensis]|uniref:hypothetical protein n=1 Tax=Nocardia tengchongensis TaxID=2055889 RepID=UPI0033DCC607